MSAVYITNKDIRVRRSFASGEGRGRGTWSRIRGGRHNSWLGG